MTGVVAHPRYGTDNERELAKRYPEIKVSRAMMDAAAEYFRSLEEMRADAIQRASAVLPQAFHELRKLNGAVLQNAEKEMRERGDSRNLRNVKGAAELMRNNFDILEALSNIEGMKVVPTDATINVFDLVFKTKRILEERAADQGMGIVVDGVRAIIKGSQKSFPIVPAVLLENAIKYGRQRKFIRADVMAVDRQVIFTVENETDHYIDPQRCFDRGVRHATVVEGGGFGLFLAREIVLSHGGTIRCESAPGKVKMIVELPLLDVIAHLPQQGPG
jgi:two-component system, OmpR family, heavy metal sensor histidine kinase CusS